MNSLNSPNSPNSPNAEPPSPDLASGYKLHRAGQLAQAERVYRQILQTNPNTAEAWHLLGLLAVQSGQPQAAVGYLERATDLDPGCALYWSGLGMVCRDLAQFERAAAAYRRAIQVQPDDADLHANLAAVLEQAGQFDQAIGAYRQGLALNPAHRWACRQLGFLLWRQERLDEAVANLQQAVRLDPTDAGALHLLGVIFSRQGRLQPALDCFAQAARLRPNSAREQYNWGLALWRLGRGDEAELLLRRALHLQPDYPEVYFNLGAIAQQRSQLQQAADLWQQALTLKPDYADACHNLGLLYLRADQFGRAEEHLRRVVQLQPDNAPASYDLAVTLVQQDDVETAGRFYNQALRRRPQNVLWQLEKDTLCPAIMESTAAIAGWRARYQAGLDRHPPGSIRLNAWLDKLPTTNAFPNWNLNFHGQNERELRLKYARIFSVTEIEPPPAQKPRHPGGTFRVGFLVTSGHEGIFLSLLGGVINQMTDPELAVQIICPPDSVPLIRPKILNERVNFLPLPADMTDAVQIIKAERLDLILHWEVGSDSVNYFLPFFRLAPVQCATWGLSITTGLPQIDYFISSDLLEVADAQAHYSERLVKLATLPTYFYRPQLPAPLKPRSYFGLPKEEHIYLCSQNLLKVHPDFDPLLAEILRRDPQGNVLFLAGRSRQWQQKLMARFRKVMPAVAGRIRFLPRQSKQDFLNLIAVADVNLDTLHYSGGNTAHEGLAIGTPIVTLPSEFLRGRLTLGRYKKMGVLDCVAASPAEYVEIALRLGLDADYRQYIRRKILQASHTLYQDDEAVVQLVHFFKQAILAARAGELVEG